MHVGSWVGKTVGEVGRVAALGLEHLHDLLVQIGDNGGGGFTTLSTYGGAEKYKE